MKTMFRTRILGAVLVVMMISATEAAVTLSNTATNLGRIQTFSYVRPGSWAATPFTTDGSDYQMNSVAAEIGDWIPTWGLFMSVWSVDAATAKPDTVYAGLTLTTDTNGLKTFSSDVALMANTSYFIVVGVTNGGGTWTHIVNNAGSDLTVTGPDFIVDAGVWALNTLSNSVPIEMSYRSPDFGVSWDPDNLLASPLRMEIEAIAVPEPATFGLIGLAGICMFARRKLLFLGNKERVSGDRFEERF